VAARLIALFSRPDDPDAFDAHYREVHTPIVLDYPGLRELRVTKADGVGGREPAFYLMAEMGFDSRADLDAALSSEPGRESGRDLRTFARAGVTLMIVDDAASSLAEPGS
jgi:uncharacterized protein (TIGR02118 family)